MSGPPAFLAAIRERGDAPPSAEKKTTAAPKKPPPSKTVSTRKAGVLSNHDGAAASAMNMLKPGTNDVSAKAKEPTAGPTPSAQALMAAIANGAVGLRKTGNLEKAEKKTQAFGAKKGGGVSHLPPRTAPVTRNNMMSELAKKQQAKASSSPRHSPKAAPTSTHTAMQSKSPTSMENSEKTGAPTPKPAVATPRATKPEHDTALPSTAPSAQGTPEPSSGSHSPALPESKSGLPIPAPVVLSQPSRTQNSAKPAIPARPTAHSATPIPQLRTSPSPGVRPGPPPPRRQSDRRPDHSGAGVKMHHSGKFKVLVDRSKVVAAFQKMGCRYVGIPSK